MTPATQRKIFTAHMTGSNSQEWDDKVQILDTILQKGNTKYLVLVKKTESKLSSRVGKILIIDPTQIVK